MVSRETRDVPQEEWKVFFDKLSTELRGWKMTVEVLLGEEGAQHLVEELPLLGISVDEKGSQASSIDIDAGVSPDDHIEHSIPHPTHVRWVAGLGLSGALEIESDDSPTTIVEIHPPEA
jgi:hypothetical protein